MGDQPNSALTTLGRRAIAQPATRPSLRFTTVTTKPELTIPRRSNHPHMRRAMTTQARRLAVATMLSLAVLSGCDNDEPLLSVPSAADRSVATTAELPFYYHQGEKIYLRVDPSRLVVASALPPAEADAAIRQVLRSSGVEVASTEPLHHVRNHRLIRLASGAAPSEVLSAAVRQLRADPRIRFATYAHKSVEDGGDVLLVNRVIVQFRKGVSSAQIDSLNKALGTYVVRQPQPDSAYTWHWLGYPEDATSDPLRTAAVLDRHSLVEWADPDKISAHRSLAVPFDPFFPLQYYLQNSITRNGIPVDINAVPAWNLTLGSEAVRVAILDNGVEFNHPEFYPRNANYYDSFGGAYCNDMVTFSSAAHPCPQDSHGTKVAGVLLARHDGVGVAGTSPNVYMMFGRISKEGRYNTEGEIAKTITWAWNSGAADVISNSWGGGSPSNAITDAIRKAVTYGRGGKGTVVVFAAGNDSRRYVDGYIAPVVYPARLSEVIAVAAINRNGDVAGYSSGGPEIDIAGLSSAVLGCGNADVVTTTQSAYRSNCLDGVNENYDYTSSFGGTSAAAPQVAGVAALLLTREPGLTYSSVRSRLFNNADPWGASTDVGAGKLNAYRTLAPSGGGGGSEPPPPPDCTDPTVIVC